MDITVEGKQIDVGENLREYVIDKIEELNEKYFNHTNSATVTFSKEGHGHGTFRAHIKIMIGKNVSVIVDDEAGDIYAAFDSATEKAAKKMRRNKKRMRDHHERGMKAIDAEEIEARGYIIALEEREAEEEKDEPIVVAEMTTNIATMSVSEAVMRLDLSDENAFMFRNSSNNSLNMVYRRSDGNIGWVDPEQCLGKKEAAA